MVDEYFVKERCFVISMVKVRMRQTDTRSTTIEMQSQPTDRPDDAMPIRIRSQGPPTLLTNMQPMHARTQNWDFRTQVHVRVRGGIPTYLTSPTYPSFYERGFFPGMSGTMLYLESERG